MKRIKIITGEKYVEAWKNKFYPVLPHDKEWSKFKWHICKKGESLNPLLVSNGGEIQVEQFGIIGCLFKIKDKTFPEKKLYFYQCPLIEARETGTGKFGEWLKNVKDFVRKEFNSPLALATITNQHLYKYCEKYDVNVAVDDRLYKVKINVKREKKLSTGRGVDKKGSNDKL
ncbi:hypothetical protein M0R01_04630 [bacterium]|jgi:hypothetical protein|nr:hypothetical protein [bacterium]